MLPENIAFGIIAAAMVIGALRVVTTANIVHAALYLVIVLAGAAALYVLLGAEFVAVTQVLVYIGAIIVLFLFGIMLTRAPIGRLPEVDNENRWAGLAVALFLLGVLVSSLADAFGKDKFPPIAVQTTTDVADALFSTYVFPFEVASVLLLAALVGAVVIARRD